jgi:hypothetical protein
MTLSLVLLDVVPPSSVGMRLLLALDLEGACRSC